MKTIWNLTRSCIMAFLMSTTILLPVENHERNGTFSSLNGSQITSIALCAGLGIVVGIIWDMHRQEQHPANQQPSTIKKITQRTLSGIFGGALGLIIGINQLQPSNATHATAADHTEPRHDQPPRHMQPIRQQPIRPANRHPVQPPVQPAPAPQGDCPICLEEIKNIPAARLVRTSCCKNLLCKECLKAVLQRKHECPLCRNTNIQMP